MPELLEQQQLIESAPPRRLQVDPLQTAHYGIDPSTRGLSIAYVASDGSRGARTVPFPRMEGAQRLAEIDALTRAGIAAILKTWPWPGIVWVEQPGQANPNWPLAYAVGVTLAAVYAALRDEMGLVPQIETVPPSSWKKIACGHGGIRKPKPGQGEYPVLTWARLNGYAGSSWDEADSWAIAEAARRTVALVER